MPLRREDLPTDPDQLIALALELAAENERLRAALKTINTLHFGTKSERLVVVVDGQMTLGLGDLATDASPPPPPANDAGTAKPKASARPSHKPARRNIGALPTHLPRCERVIEPDNTRCPCCSGRMHRIGECATEELDIVPAILRVLRTVRPKYGCRACESAVVQAPAPSRLITAGMASTALISWVVVSRFAWAMPLNRQTRMLASYGIALDCSTLVHWVDRAAWWLEGLYDLQLKTIHSFQHVFCDETPLPVLEKGRRRTRKCQLWAHAVDDGPWQGPAPPAVAYVFSTGRNTEAIATQLGDDFTGILQVDGYGAYKALVKRTRRGKIRLAFCLAHARRKFVAVHKTTQSTAAAEILVEIAAIYAIEKRIRGGTADQRLAVRQAESKPLMAALKRRLTELLAEISVKSTLAAAIRYTLRHWDGLTLFLEDGRVEADSNTVERSMRIIGQGRHSSLFAGSERGGRTWAILTSLLNTCRLNDVDPLTWLTDVLERIVSGRTKSHQLHELLVWNWKAARMPQSLQEAA
ncbi:transposase (plasmid) [Rhodovastum atsumiense]|uniref:IS66 family transposase n=1 Tax=Rhodovastum atsumiense TaxID=504468 RepID=UPI0020251926|nr:IS66 family transposase [Rhodovastum atsumiense]CAH2605870.1 transposase [Rhodovastum atsumiense]